jgi:hypothetical protein
MAKCSLIGCNEKAVGGFQAIIDAGDMVNPTTTRLGLKTAWCHDHRESIVADLSGKRGRYLTQQEMDISERA